MPRKRTTAGRSLAIEWPRPGVTRMSEVEVPRARPGEVTVEVAVSVVSPGTERARFLALENADVRFPHQPGYQAAGQVTHDPAATLTGKNVAIRLAPHQRSVTVPLAQIHEVPSGVDLAAAATWHLGIVVLHGLNSGSDEPIDSIAVVGSGLVGVLARRLAAARGVTRVVAVASSDSKRWTTDPEHATEFFLATGELAEVDAGVVIDATGTADGLLMAAGIAPSGATVVVLGSPRCDIGPLPVAEMRRKGLRVVGAHINTLALRADVQSGIDPERELSAEFFEHLRTQRLVLDDVLAERVPPSDAAVLYRRLVWDRTLVGACFDWEQPSTASIASARTLAPPSTAPADHPPVRFGLLGCGDIGVMNAAAIAHAIGAELVACFDPLDALATDVSSSYAAEVTPSWEALVDHRNVDVVFIATPHDLHEPLVVAAINAGKHVVVEKPLAADLAAAARIAAAARQASTTVTVCLPMRCDPRVMAARAAIDAGQLGVTRGALSTYLGDKPSSYYFGGFSSRASSTWRLSKERSGGGVLIMNLVHHLDLVRYLFGCEALSVRASALTTGPPLDIEDLASVIVEFDGKVATFVGGSRVVAGPGESLRLWGDAGQVEILPKSTMHSLLAQPSEPPAHARSARSRLVRRRWRPAIEPKLDEELERRVRFVENAASALARGEQPGPDADDGLAIQTLVAAAYQSAEQDAVIRPDDLLRGIAT